MIDRDRILSTHRLIEPHVRRTPILRSSGEELGLEPFPLELKLELMQHSGSFKARGAFSTLLQREIPPAGVVAASGGNHGAAVAYAARSLGVPARIFVPSISSPAKVSRIREYGADLVVGGDRYADALAASAEWATASGALPVHAYDQEETILGQATVGVELEEQAPRLDTLLVAVGGGGLIGGIAAWYAGRVRIVAVEPEGAPTLARALEAGRPVEVEVGGVAADSLGARQAGTLMFPIAARYVDRALLVSDDAIVAAQAALWSRYRVVAEAGGATALGALLSGAYRPAPDERVGVVVCGGNSTAVTFTQPSRPE